MTQNEETQILLLGELIMEIAQSKRLMQNMGMKKVKQNANVSTFSSNIPYFNYKSNSSNNFKDPFPEAVASAEFETSANHDMFVGKYIIER